VSGRRRRIATVALAACTWAAGGAAAGQARPQLRVSDEAVGCGEIAGRYVALFSEEQGILVLSGAPFPGGRPADRTADESIAVRRRGGRTWVVQQAVAGGGTGDVWAARYGFRVRPVTGCVSFDKDRFSAEGDLASYVSWLVETVYARLPGDVRAQRPALRLADRVVRLRASRDGSAPIVLEGTEGSTLAFRFADGPRLYLAIPYVLDDASGRLAVEIGSTDADYFEPAAKEMLGFVVVEPGRPATVDGLGIRLAVTDVMSP